MEQSSELRVLSLLSATTEIVCRLGCSHLLVGRSHGCDDPQIVTTFPIVTSPRVDPNATSREIDEAVRVQSASGGPIYKINSQSVQQLKPDVIITQEQCRICAVTPEDVAAACGLLPNTQLVTIKPETLDHVFGDVRSIASALRVPERGDRLVQMMQARLALLSTLTKPAPADAVATSSVATSSVVPPTTPEGPPPPPAVAVATTPTPTTTPATTPEASQSPPVTAMPGPNPNPSLNPGSPRVPKVAHLEWLAPLMGSGYWIAELMNFANCEMVHGTRGGHSMTIDTPALLSNADVILIAPCGFSIERTHAELQLLGDLLSSEEWRSLPAVKAGAVAIADGNLLFNRSSCRIVESAEIVGEVAHEACKGLFGHHGNQWVWLHELDAFCSRIGAPSATKAVKVAKLVDDDDGDRHEPDVETMNPVDCTSSTPEAPKAQRDNAFATIRTIPTQHVLAQLKALQDGDYDHAFAMNSKANRARIGDAVTFEKVVQGVPSFRVLVAKGTQCHVSCPDDSACSQQQQQLGGATDTSTDTGMASAEIPAKDEREVSVRAQAQDTTGVVHFKFDVSLGGAGWETDGVRIEC